jgi:acetoin utilization deacetylase AcuC-like enzyme
MSRAGFIFDAAMREHDTGPGHPEQPMRLSAVLQRFERSGTIDMMDRLKARAATEDELALVHDQSYIGVAKRDVERKRGQLSTGDTAISERSFECAKMAAGCVLTAADAVLGRKNKKCFCLVRPPGHHAERKRGMGFCLFNNIAIGARYAQQRYGVERVLIVDWDVHHGNGTQQIFYDDPSVLFFSTHQWPWYPGTGARNETGQGKGEGATINCPLPAGSGREEIVGAFRELLVPAAKNFKPDLIMISAGFDSRINDPLGLFRLEDDDFAELTWMMLELAEKSPTGGIISVLEGGYNLAGLASAADAHVRALAD